MPADGYYQVRRYAVEYLAPQGITVIEAKSADIIDAASGRRCGACRDTVEPRPRRGRPSCPRMTCRGHGATLSSTTHRDTLWAATVVAWRRPRGGQRHKGTVGTPRPSRGIRGGSHLDQMRRSNRSVASRADPRCFEAWLVLRSIATAACGSSASARTRARHGVDVAHTSGRAIRAVSRPGRRPVARGRQSADETLRWIVAIELERCRGRASRWCRTATCSSRRPASAVFTVRWIAGPLGDSVSEGFRPHLRGHRGHRRPDRRTSITRYGAEQAQVAAVDRATLGIGR